MKIPTDLPTKFMFSVRTSNMEAALITLVYCLLAKRERWS